MVESGDLEDSLAGGKDSFSRVTKSGVKVGTTLFYAIFAIAGASGKGAHSKGSRAARKGAEPARPPLGINDAEQEASRRILTDYLLGA
jgi:hypothetical protein